MIFKCLDGTETTLNIQSIHYPVRNKEECKSNLQYEVGEKLSKLFPQFSLLEEFTIPKTRLRLDFFLPQIKIAVEVQGAQHSTWNSFFYNTVGDFRRAQQRDEEKVLWCKLNDIQLIQVESEEDVRDKISKLLTP